MNDALVKQALTDFPMLPNRAFVVAQLGQSLDGRIATVTGASRSIGGPAALAHLHRLRANVDAVIVGIGTVLADDPQLTVRLVQGRSPARVVIDPNGRLPAEARCLAAPGGCLVLGTAQTLVPEGATLVPVDAEDGHLAPHAILAALFAQGFRRILVEGGARTISDFLDAGCVDRLHVAVAPMIIGSGKAALDLAPIDTLAEALRPRTKICVLDDGNVLFDCDLRSQMLVNEE